MEPEYCLRGYLLCQGSAWNSAAWGQHAAQVELVHYMRGCLLCQGSVWSSAAWGQHAAQVEPVRCRSTHVVSEGYVGHVDWARCMGAAHGARDLLLHE